MTIAPSSLFDLHGKVALVTGGNRGLGLGYARGLVRQGAQVTIWGRSQERNRAATQELCALGVGGAEACVVDVRNEDAVSTSLAEIEARHGRLDIVVTNAGVISKKESIANIDETSWRDVLATNLDGAFYTLRAAAAVMIARAEKGDRGGSLIVCGSLSVFAGTRGLAHYAASKGALAAMVKSMASELGPYGIRVNMIAPGYMRTESSLEGERAADIAARTPMRRLGAPQDVEAAVAYLASDAAAFHTGDVLVIDGGWLANLF
jgi:NAD(P)-dependent dehydrogenase (short-subunit alcohol dehydrogenase family)